VQNETFRIVQRFQTSQKHTKTVWIDSKMTESCKDFDCDYFAKFGTCTCFKQCGNCQKETLHIDKKCSICGK